MKNGTIIVRLLGGLGNQMFQYALGRNLQAKNNAILKLDLRFYSNPPGSLTKRTFGLNVFTLKPQLTSSWDLFRSEPSRKVFGGLSTVISQKVFNFTTVREAHFAFDKDILDLKGNILLEGYWHSEKYFRDIEKTLRQDFTFKRSLNKGALELEKKIGNTNSVALHVRRGDYLDSPIHSLCSPGYYSRALNHVNSKVSDLHLFIFSDDIEWAKQNLRFDHPTTYVTGLEDHIDLRLISSCDHNIIANSSFSWWAAWLNGNQHKLVIAPEKWFNKDVDTKDLIPAEWIKM